MRTINISISDLEYNKFGLTEDKYHFQNLLTLCPENLQGKI